MCCTLSKLHISVLFKAWQTKEAQKPSNIIIALCLFPILPGVHQGFKTWLLILLRGIYSERLCSWIKMSGLTAWWLGMSSLQSKCIKLVWRTQSTRSQSYRGKQMKHLWHPWEQWPYWFRSVVYKLELMGWKVDVFHVSFINCISSYQCPCKSVNPSYKTGLFAKALHFPHIYSTLQITLQYWKKTENKPALVMVSWICNSILISITSCVAILYFCLSVFVSQMQSWKRLSLLQYADVP